jgi:predicted MFS family arabinose efflux permease
MLAMLLCLPMSLLASKVGNYRMALAALLLMGGGGLVSAHAHDFNTLMLGRITEGFGFVMIAVTAPALIARAVTTQDRPIAMTMWSLWLPVGVSATLLAAPLLVAWSGWRLLWTASGWVALMWVLVLGVAFFNVGRSGDRQAAITRIELADLFHRDSWLLVLSFICFSSVYTAAIAFAPTFWHEVHRMSLASGALLLVPAMLGTIVGNISSGLLIKRGYPVNRLLAACFVVPALLGGLAFVEGLPFWLQYMCFISFTTLTGMVPTAIMAVAPAYTHSHVQIGPIVALVFQGATTGQVIGPVLLSQLIEYQQHNWTWGLLFFGGFAVVGGSLMYLIRPPQPLSR